MKLWKISDADTSGLDAYDSAIVAAETEDEARQIHPGGLDASEKVSWCWSWTSPEFVAVEYIGEAKAGTNRSVILASYNAG